MTPIRTDVSAQALPAWVRMKHLRPFLLAGAVVLLCRPAEAQQVLVTDSGVTTGLIGPGAPKHTIGLQRHSQTISLDTGRRLYGIRYVIARDPEAPTSAIPGEGYIGMPEPTNCNWYGAGFFDLQLNGRSIGTTLIHALVGRAAGDRGMADLLFDHPLALIRIRFVAIADGDCLFAQVLLEPKEAIAEARVVTRCYPSGFIRDSGSRRVRTAKRDVKEGESATLDQDAEYWTLYDDQAVDAGSAAPNGTLGVGPCAMLWLPEVTGKAAFTVGSYGIETSLPLDPGRRDFRFVFIDYHGTANAVAAADLRTRAPALRRELADFRFLAPDLAAWPLAQRQAEVQEALALLPGDREAALRYTRWGQELDALLQTLAAGDGALIHAEDRAARLIADWERGLPELRLKALLNGI